jgi:hypothetical protein
MWDDLARTSSPEEHHEVKEQREEGQAVGTQARLEASSTTVSGSSGAKT